MGAGVPAGQVLSVPAIINHAHVRDRGFVTEIEAPGGTQRLTRCGFRFGDANPAPAGPAPALSAQTDAWLRRLGYDEAAIAAMHDEGAV